MLIVGVDPGLTGALALICSRRGLLDIVDVPTCPNGIASARNMRHVDADAVHLLLSLWSSRFEWAKESVRGIIERPIAMPTLPASTVASQFDTFGVLRYALPAAGADATIVNPKQWKAVFGLGSDKEAARACALRLYPGAAELLKRKSDHNRADALLIGHYGLKDWL